MSTKISDGEDLVKHFQDYIHSSRLIVQSNVPQACKEMPCLLGVDEAGRGPVLGPMVYGIAYCPLEKADDFENLGCDDSKALTEKKREEIFAILCACEDYVGWSVDVISPTHISNQMLKRAKVSLNEIALQSTVTLIKKVIDEGVQVAEIFVDTVGPPEKYQERLSGIFPQCKVRVEKKADSIFPIVSGASICAKVCRDRVLSSWTFSENLDIAQAKLGSGYPGDPETKKFLTDHLDNIFGFPTVVRFSWSTASKILESSAAQVEWEDILDEEQGQPSIACYFSKKTSNSHSMKHSYFKDNSLTNLDSF